jgi:integral membrane sensor domain MASE1
MEISLEKEEAMEAGVLLLLLTLLSAVVFGGWLKISAKNYPIAFICGPIVIWTAFRFTQRETATGIFILSSDSGVGNSARLWAICWSK